MTASLSTLTEDDIYRSSTQYRHWSFTTPSLAAQRSATNELAVARVRDAIRRARKEAGANGESVPEDVDCLTTEEELKLVGFYCVRAMELADFCELPTNIKATAVQYLKRFYLSNSPMTYHPKQMMPSALFLATKTDNHYMSLKSFAAKLHKSTEESVIAPEFLLTQGLRFTFDVRHPHRGLEGGFMELQAMAMGKYEPRGTASPRLPSKQILDQMLQIQAADKEQAPEKSIAGIQSRIQRAHQKASQLLKSSAILSDTYFLYTPSQIWLAALYAADEPLAKFYVHNILTDAAERMEVEVIKTIQGCVSLLEARSDSGKPGSEEVADLRRIDKKLYKCQNPEKMDLVGLNKAKKANATEENGEGSGDGGGEGAVTSEKADETMVKKRRVERNPDDMFGPSISK